MNVTRWCILVGSVLLCAGFTDDSAGRACVQQKGERGVGYDINKTKIEDAYSPNGRRLLKDGQRVYNIEVPALMKRDKPVACTMSLANGLWTAPEPGVFERNPFAIGNSPFTSHEKPEPDSQ